MDISSIYTITVGRIRVTHPRDCVRRTICPCVRVRINRSQTPHKKLKCYSKIIINFILRALVNKVLYEQREVLWVVPERGKTMLKHFTNAITL